MANKRARSGSLARLVEELAPGGRLAGRRRLRGGLGARMDVLDIERADGSRFQVSLRRFVREHRSSQPEHVAHEYRVLQLLEEAGVAAPRPLLLDAEGRRLGVPAMVLEYIPGRPVYRPRDVESWARELAGGLLSVHAVAPRRFDLSWLSVHLRDGIRDELTQQDEAARAAGGLALEVYAALREDIDRIEWPAATLVHDDFWPGNTVWRSGRLEAIVDWTYAEVGDPRTDVAQCRLDIAAILDLEAAEAFGAAYQALAPRPLPQVWYFDLLRGLRALLSYERWLPGYHDAGLTYVTARRFRERIEAFLSRVLEEEEDTAS